MLQMRLRRLLHPENHKLTDWNFVRGSELMIRAAAEFPSHKSLTLLSRTLLQPREGETAPSRLRTELTHDLLCIGPEEFDDALALAHSNHVDVRWLEAVLNLTRGERDAALVPWAEDALAAERARIANAVEFLSRICAKFYESRYDVTVIKSLDHWPDLGSDLDLYTNADIDQVIKLFMTSFGASIAPRSWGDRLANKWNFIIPGLPEPVEVHAGRLGQTGEQLIIASSLVSRARRVSFGNYQFQITSVPDRLMISTLQRMYRHFNFRLCDIVDSAALADAGAIDYEQLKSLATRAGIWEGMATYLQIVSDYVKSYRGTGIDLPRFVRDAARFGGKEVFYNRGYLRVPLMPQSARLYGSQLVGVLGRGELENSARLSLLPWLATVAAAKQRLTGSDKGIW